MRPTAETHDACSFIRQVFQRRLSESTKASYSQFPSFLFSLTKSESVWARQTEINNSSRIPRCLNYWYKGAKGKNGKKRILVLARHCLHSNHHEKGGGSPERCLTTTHSLDISLSGNAIPFRKLKFPFSTVKGLEKSVTVAFQNVKHQQVRSLVSKDVISPRHKDQSSFSVRPSLFSRMENLSHKNVHIRHTQSWHSELLKRKLEDLQRR